MGLLQKNKQSPSGGKKEKSGKVAFSLSVLFHLALLLLVGGVVLIPAVVQKAAFLGDPNATGTMESIVDTPPDTSNIQNELPNSEVPQENMVMPEQPNPVAPTDIVIARQDSSMASSSWASSVSKTHTVSAKMPVFGQDAKDKNDTSPHDEKEKKVSSSATRITLFGSNDSDAKTRGLEGYLYDLKQTPDKKPTEMKVTSKSSDFEVFGKEEGPQNGDASKIMSEFVKTDFKASVLKRFYRVKDPLYMTFLMIPSIDAELAPKEFNVEKEMKGRRWIVHYTGKISPKESGRYRFWGIADDIMFVGINGKIVLNGSLGNLGGLSKDEEIVYFEPEKSKQSLAKPPMWDPKNEKPIRRNQYPRMGKWVQMNAGEKYPIDVMIGEVPGGGFRANLLIEKEGVEYRKHPDGFPIFPLFLLNDAKIDNKLKSEWESIPFKFTDRECPVFTTSE